MKRGLGLSLILIVVVLIALFLYFYNYDDYDSQIVRDSSVCFSNNILGYLDRCLFNLGQLYVFSTGDIDEGKHPDSEEVFDRSHGICDLAPLNIISGKVFFGGSTFTGSKKEYCYYALADYVAFVKEYDRSSQPYEENKSKTVENIKVDHIIKLCKLIENITISDDCLSKVSNRFVAFTSEEFNLICNSINSENKRRLCLQENFIFKTNLYG